MKKIRLHINYLHIYTAKVNCLKHELKNLQEQAEITTDKNDVENLTQALEELKAVLKSIPTVEKGEAYK